MTRCTVNLAAVPACWTYPVSAELSPTPGWMSAQVEDAQPQLFDDPPHLRTDVVGQALLLSPLQICDQGVEGVPTLANSWAMPSWISRPVGDVPHWWLLVRTSANRRPLSSRRAASWCVCAPVSGRRSQRPYRRSAGRRCPSRESNSRGMIASCCELPETIPCRCAAGRWPRLHARQGQ